MTLARSVALMVAIALACAGFFLFTESPRVTPEAASRDAEVATEVASAATLHAPQLAETQRSSGGAPAVVPTEPDVAPPEPDVAPLHPSRLILELDVLGPTHTAPVTLSIRGRSDGEPFVTGDPIVASCRVPSVTRVDLTPLLEGRLALAAVLVEADHPALTAKRVSVDIDVRHPQDGRGTEPVRATLTLRHAFSVYGRVQGAVAGARAGIWRLKDGRPAGRPESHTEVREDGEFELAVKEAAQYLVVVASDGARPAHATVWTSASSPRVDAGVFDLALGASVDGRVVVGGEAPPFPASFTLRARDSGEGLSWHWTQGDSPLEGLAYDGQRVTRADIDVVTEGDGTFACVGLETGAYGVSVHGFERGHMRAERPELSLVAPSSGVEIELGLSIVRLVFVHPDDSIGPADGELTLSIEGREPEEHRVPAGKLWGSATCEFVLTPHARFDVEYTPEGGVPVAQSLVAPAAGETLEVAIDVPPAGAVGALEIRLFGAVPPVGTAFMVHVEEATEGPPDRNFGGFDGSRAEKAQLEEGGVLRVADVAAGHVRVLLYPGTWAGHRGSYHLDAVGEADVPTGGTGRMDLNLELAGKLKIGKRDGSGGWSQVPCVVKNERGEVLPVTFVAYAPNGGGAAASHDVIVDLAPSLVFPNPMPGRYHVEVGGETRDVVVRAGETASVIFD